MVHRWVPQLQESPAWQEWPAGVLQENPAWLAWHLEVTPSFFVAGLRRLAASQCLEQPARTNWPLQPRCPRGLVENLFRCL